ncbi:hypothetical protein [Paenibacillus sp.]|uniref:hypothetical protein n=1 Tax=Paenibacillus sp. TaxID=58172 RepID=UPI002D614221|nr:hypothetical protein [Paenibacillus sp.]HZG55723.1 hypothetical protein [Paenibacillus sp.]
MTLHELKRIRVESCHEYVGMPVCAVLRDGTHVYGVLAGTQDGRIYLHRAVKGPGKMAVNVTKAKRTLRAKAKALGPYPYGPYYPGAYALDAAAIALLFALPFFLY